MRQDLDPRHADVRLLDLGPTQLAHRVVGRGPDIVFVHGWPLHGLTWRNVVPHLAPRFRCHLVDLPGTGASRHTRETVFGLEAHARTLRAALEQVGLERFALVGHDSGAAVTRFLAAELGERVWGNVIAGTEIPGHRPLLLQLLLLGMKLPGGARALPAVLGSPRLRRSVLGWGACFDDIDRADPEFFELFSDPLVRSRRVMAGQMKLAQHWDWAATDRLREAHARITAPTLLLWGERDPYFPAAKAREMAAQLAGGATFVGWKDARLFPHEEHPARFAAEVERFLTPLAERLTPRATTTEA